MTYETDIYQIICGKEDISDALFCPLSARAKNLALLFGISSLPSCDRIRIDIMGRKRFEIEKGLHFGKNASPEIVSFSTERVCVVSYHAISNQYAPEEYRRVILHELVHVLQWITTRIPPERNVWLYEAAACYLAGQTADISRIKDAAPWEMVKRSFYAIPGCYAIAYHLGAALLSDCAPGEVAALCSDASRCEAICAEVYASLFK